MRPSSLIVLLGAAGCAAAAALLTVTLLAGRSEPPPPVAVKSGPETRTIVIAAVPLKFGTVLTPELLAEISWPAGSFPPEAFSSKDALVRGGSRTVLAAIAKDEPITASKITAPGQRAALSVLIEEGKKAVTIRVDDVLGVAGFVQPEDRVDVLLTRAERNAVGIKPAPGSAYTDVLLQNVRVLAIDQLADRTTSARPAKAITVEVDTNEAQKLVLAASVGQLSLALRRSGWMQTVEPVRVGLEHLPANRQVEAPPAAPVEEPTVTVIRGATDRKQYDLSTDVRRQVPEVVSAEAQVERTPGDRSEAGDLPR